MSICSWPANSTISFFTPTATALQQSNREQSNFGTREAHGPGHPSRPPGSIPGPEPGSITIATAGWTCGWRCGRENRSGGYRCSDGDGQFTPVISPVSSEAIDTAGGAWADIDNDGDPDLVVTAFIFASGMYTSPNPLFVNDGIGKFTRQNPSPFGPTSDPNEVSQEAAWGDFDNDGDLDLFLAYTGSLPNLLFRNNGDGTKPGLLELRY
jgi:hypothetical protein